MALPDCQSWIYHPNNFLKAICCFREWSKPFSRSLGGVACSHWGRCTEQTCSTCAPCSVPSGMDAVLGEGFGALFTGVLLAPGIVGGAQHTVDAGERLTRERVWSFRSRAHPLPRERRLSYRLPAVFSQGSLTSKPSFVTNTRRAQAFLRKSKQSWIRSEKWIIKLVLTGSM